MIEFDLKKFSEDKILNKYLKIKEISNNYRLSTIGNKLPFLYELLEKFSLEFSIELDKSRKIYLKLYKYYTSEEWLNYKSINDKESASNFLNKIKGSSLYTKNKEIIIRNNYPNIFIYWKQEENEKWNSFIYRILNRINSIPSCPYCDSSRKFIDKNTGFAETCMSRDCYSKYRKNLYDNLTPEEKKIKTTKI